MKLAAVVLFLASLFGLAVAQPVVISGPAGYNADSPYNRLYNTSSVITFKGRVTGKEVAPPMKGMGNAVTLLVTTPKGVVWHVDVGPEWFVNNQHTHINIKDQVQVTGSRVMIDGHSVILAEQIVDKKEVLALRRPMGRPYWDAVYVSEPNNYDQNHQLVGKVTNIDSFNDGTNGPTQRLTIHTDDGTYQVALAPEWFMQRQAVQIALGSTVDIRTWAPVGVPTIPAGRGLVAPPIVFATMLGYGQHWMVFRSFDGTPMWYGSGG
ncbi:MAG TPA: hypothetical protein VHE55_18305 [Fimbriimonadaceae bacterium]|nr:hypothetical protein [Fimbriimonadaceae bacterium]